MAEKGSGVWDTLKYCPEMLQNMKDYYDNCDWKGSDRECLTHIGISETAAYEYEEKFQEFKEVRDAGKAIALGKFLQFGYDNVGSEKFNHNIYNFLGRAIHNLPNERLLKSRLLRDAKTVKKQGEAIIHETATAKFTTKEAQSLSSTVSNLANATKTSELEERVDVLTKIIEKLQENESAR